MPKLIDEIKRIGFTALDRADGDSKTENQIEENLEKIYQELSKAQGFLRSPSTKWLYATDCLFAGDSGDKNFLIWAAYFHDDVAVKWFLKKMQTIKNNFKENDKGNFIDNSIQRSYSHIDNYGKNATDYAATFEDYNLPEVKADNISILRKRNVFETLKDKVPMRTGWRGTGKHSTNIFIDATRVGNLWLLQNHQSECDLFLERFSCLYHKDFINTFRNETYLACLLESNCLEVFNFWQSRPNKYIPNILPYLQDPFYLLKEMQKKGNHLLHAFYSELTHNPELVEKIKPLRCVNYTSEDDVTALKFLFDNFSMNEIALCLKQQNQLRFILKIYDKAFQIGLDVRIFHPIFRQLKNENKIVKELDFRNDLNGLFGCAIKTDDFELINLLSTYNPQVAPSFLENKKLSQRMISLISFISHVKNYKGMACKELERKKFNDLDPLDLQCIQDYFEGDEVSQNYVRLIIEEFALSNNISNNVTNDVSPPNYQEANINHLVEPINNNNNAILSHNLFSPNHEKHKHKFNQLLLMYETSKNLLLEFTQKHSSFNETLPEELKEEKSNQFELNTPS